MLCRLIGYILLKCNFKNWECNLKRPSKKQKFCHIIIIYLFYPIDTENLHGKKIKYCRMPMLFIFIHHGWQFTLPGSKMDKTHHKSTIKVNQCIFCPIFLLSAVMFFCRPTQMLALSWFPQHFHYLLDYCTK